MPDLGLDVLFKGKNMARLLGGRKAVFRPASPVSLPDWFRARNEDIARREAEHQKNAAQKSYVEKSNTTGLSKSGSVTVTSQVAV